MRLDVYDRLAPDVLIHLASQRGLSRRDHVRIVVAAARLVVPRLWYGREIAQAALDAVEAHTGPEPLPGLRSAIFEVRARQWFPPHPIERNADNDLAHHGGVYMRYSDCAACSAAEACVEAVVGSESDDGWLRSFTASAVTWATRAAAATAGCWGRADEARPSKQLPSDAIRKVCEQHIPRAFFAKGGNGGDGDGTEGKTR